VIKKAAGILVDPGGFFCHFASSPAKELVTMICGNMVSAALFSFCG
jgi:hypothetical protein